MKRVLFLLLVLAGLVWPVPAQEALPKNDVQAATDSGKAKAKKKCRDIGLELWDITGNTFHSVWIYTQRAWVEKQSCEAAMEKREVSLTDADVQSVLHVYVVPWSVPQGARATNSPCPVLEAVVLKDESRKSVLQPKTTEKQIVSMRSKYDWGTFSCQMIVATFSMSDLAALRALSPKAEFLVTVATYRVKAPVDANWKVQVKHFKKLL